MALSVMRYKNYTWPHNPKIYQVAFKRQIAVHKVPFGQYMLQNLGRTHRVLQGEGEFSGPDAYEEFKKLAAVFYDNTPGMLVHPIWQASQVYFTELTLRQQPQENYVCYTFTFWEDCSDYISGMKTIYAPENPPKPEETWYTVVYGDTLWDIARRNGMSLNQLLAINPQVRNPNILYPGDQIRVQ